MPGGAVEGEWAVTRDVVPGGPEGERGPEAPLKEGHYSPSLSSHSWRGRYNVRRTSLDTVSPGIPEEEGGEM